MTRTWMTLMGVLITMTSAMAVMLAVVTEVMPAAVVVNEPRASYKSGIPHYHLD